MSPKKTAAKPTRTTSASGRWAPKKATDNAIKTFEERFAKDMGVDLHAGGSDDYQVVSTGSMYLDDVLGIGGYPTGRIVEIWGPEHAGKTTLAMVAVAQYQKQFPDKMTAWVDMEQTFDWEWAKKMGIDPKRIWLVTPKTAEETADAARRFMESGLCSVVVIDSIGGMISRIEYEKEADEVTVGLVAKIVTRMVKQCSPIGKSNGTTTIVINQVRAVIDSYGPSEDTAGGWALKHVTSMKLQVKRGGEPRKVSVNGEQVPIGHEMAIRVQKNKMAPYGRVARVWLHNTATPKYPLGIDMVPEVFTLAKQHTLLGEKKGGYYMMPSGVEVRSEDSAVEFLRNNPGDVEVLRSRILAKHNDEIGTTEEVNDDDLGISEMVE